MVTPGTLSLCVGAVQEATAPHWPGSMASGPMFAGQLLMVGACVSELTVTEVVHVAASPAGLGDGDSGNIILVRRRRPGSHRPALARVHGQRPDVRRTAADGGRLRVGADRDRGGARGRFARRSGRW